MDIQLVIPFCEQCGIHDYAVLLAEHLPGAGIRHALNSASPACDVLHVQYEPTLFRQGRKNRFPVLKECVARARVVTVHEVYESNPFIAPLPQGPGPMGALRRLKYRLIHRLEFLEESFAAQDFFAHAILVHTRAAKALLVAKGASPDKIHVLPHPVFPLPPGTAPLPSSPGGPRTILVFGFLSPANDYGLLLDAFTRVRERARLVIAGTVRRPEDKGLEEKLALDIARRGLTDRVKRTGYVESGKLAALFSCADLFVSPARVKTGSGTLARALGAGLPVIAADLPHVREINNEVADCIAAYPAGDPAALAACLSTLLDDTAARAARERVQAYARKHSLAAFAEAHVQLYRRLLESSA